MADFNFYLNRQGIQGVQGEKGDQGYSPTVEVVTNTAAEYILKVTTEDNEFYTPNLRGSAVEDLGGTYMRYDPDTQQMFAGPPDYATEDEWGVVQLATDDDIIGASTTKVVTAERITDINATLAEHESTMTTMQTEIEAISGDIPDISGLATKSELSTEVSDRTAADTALDNKIDNVFDAIPDVSGLATKAEVQAVEAQIPTVNNGALTISQDGVLLGTYTGNQAGTTAISLTTPQTIDITTTLTSQSTNEEVPGAKVVYDTIQDVYREQTSLDARLGIVEDTYVTSSEVNSAVSSGISSTLTTTVTSSDTTHTPVGSAVYDFVTTQISQITPSAPTNMVTTDTAQTISGLKTFGSGDHNSLFTPSATVRFADGNYRRVDELKIATSNTLGYSDQASYTQVTLDAVGGSGSSRTYGRIGVAPYSSGKLITEIQATGGYGRLTMTPTGLTYNANGTSYNILNPSINVATSSSVGTVKPDGTTTAVDASGTLSTINMVQSTAISQIVQVTQAQYDALATTDPNTFYVIIG